MNLFDEIGAILSAPLVGTLDTKHLFILVGVLLVIIAVWVMILHTLTSGVEAL